MKNSRLAKNPQFENKNAFKKEENKFSILTKLKEAHQSGNLIINCSNLSSFPEEILKYNELNLIEKFWEVYPLTKLDISDNYMKGIPDKICLFDNLSVVLAKNNQIVDFPQGLCLLPSIKLIDLSGNKINNFPEIIGEAVNLVELRISNNLISEIPSSIGKLINLEILDLNKNQISELNPNLGGLSKLKKMYISYNLVKFASDCIGLLTQAEELSFSHNNISAIHEFSFINLSNLISLDLSLNKLNAYSQIPKSSKLSILILCYNNLISLSNLSNCPNLSVLDVSNNKLSVVPKEIITLKSLHTLSLSNNAFNDIPCEIGLLPKLVRITIEGNPLKTINSSIRNANSDTIIKYLKSKNITGKDEIIEEEKTLLDSSSHANSNFWTVIMREYIVGKKAELKGLKLKAIDNVLFTLTHLTQLDFSNNCIEFIPQEISYLQNLNILNASNNKLNNINESLYLLNNLNTISFEGNFINILPEWKGVTCLDKLEYINLNRNKFTLFPKILRKCPKLHTILISQNNLKNVIEICNKYFSKVKVLDLSNNQISEIPNAFGFYLSGLEHLNLSNNNCSKIPPNIGLIQNLKTIEVIGNPIKSIRIEIISKGSNAIIDYLKKRFNPDIDNKIEDFTQFD